MVTATPDASSRIDLQFTRWRRTIDPLRNGIPGAAPSIERDLGRGGDVYKPARLRARAASTHA